MRIPRNGVAKDIRHFAGSLLVFGMIMGIMYYLTQYEIPNTNRDLLTTLVGMLAASLALIISAITGARPNELEEAKKQISSMKGLGLRKINHHVQRSDTSEIRGMIKVVKHMVEVSSK